MSTTIYLVRHAEAEGNIGRRCHGQYDSLLTKRGLEQAKIVGERFRSKHIDAVYSSDLWRARHTAMAIAEPHHLPVIERRALREIDMGEWEDKAWAELPLVTPELYDTWCNRPWLCRVPGGETIMESGTRALKEIQRIAKDENEKTVVIVCHGSAIRGILTRALGLRDDEMMQVGWGDNTCVAKMIFHDDGSIDIPYRNDNSHLPKELSTFYSLKWSDHVDVPVSPQMWFRPVDWDNINDCALALDLCRQIYCLSDSRDACLDEKMISRLKDFQSVCPEAVSFGMVDQEPGGMIAINTLENGHTAIGEVDGICIVEKYRGFGFGPQLIGNAVSIYRRMGKNVLQAKMPKNCSDAIKFYEHNDFELIKEYSDQTGEFLIMQRNIEVK